MDRTVITSESLVCRRGYEVFRGEGKSEKPHHTMTRRLPDLLSCASLMAHKTVMHATKDDGIDDSERAR